MRELEKKKQQQQQHETKNSNNASPTSQQPVASPSSTSSTSTSSFEILAFPCNQFGAQDPGSNDDINAFCQRNYGVTFPVLAKVDVNGATAEPLWDWLKAEQPGVLGLKRVKWNFEKFLVGRDGRVKRRWASVSGPEGESVRGAVLRELGLDG